MLKILTWSLAGSLLIAFATLMMGWLWGGASTEPEGIPKNGLAITLDGRHARESWGEIRQDPNLTLIVSGKDSRAVCLGNSPAVAACEWIQANRGAEDVAAFLDWLLLDENDGSPDEWFQARGWPSLGEMHAWHDDNLWRTGNARESMRLAANGNTIVIKDGKKEYIGR